MSLSAETAALQRAAHELMYLGLTGVPSIAMTCPAATVKSTT